MKIHIPRVFTYFFLACLITPTIGLSSNSVDRQKAAHVKAAYIYHLARLSQWPEQDIPGAPDTLKIYIAGSDPHDLVGLFNSQASSLKAGVHPLAIKHLRNSTEFLDFCQSLPLGERPCHLVFFTDSEANDFKACLDIADQYHILTTSEIEHFPQDGGMVGFVIDGDRVRIIVNQQAVVKASLKISAEFLQHAEIVNGLGPLEGGG